MFWKYNIWGIIWLLVIFLACSTPGEQLPPSPFIDFDKLVHLFFYGVLQLLLLRGFNKQTRYPVLQKHHVPIAFLFSSFYGTGIELWQGFVLRNRSCDVGDMIANIIAVILSTLVWVFWLKRKLNYGL